MVTLADLRRKPSTPAWADERQLIWRFVIFLLDGRIDGVWYPHSKTEADVRIALQMEMYRVAAPARRAQVRAYATRRSFTSALAYFRRTA